MSIIIIPIYKEKLTEPESLSFRQCCNVLGKYQFSLVCSNNINLEEYINILKNFNIQYSIEIFDTKFFKSTRTYNSLMLSLGFYKRFIDYDFMLIYQLDAYVFRDDLEKWCQMGYDYIGAPLISKFSIFLNGKNILKNTLNGGFSLRKVSSFIKVLINNNGENRILSKFIRGGRNEDEFFSLYANKVDTGFKVAPPEVAMDFSFERSPEKLYKLTNCKLPFGCHAWEKYNLKFWKNFIN
jgi:hypothetical protein